MYIISEMFSYPFIVKAIIAGLLVSFCASLLGVSLVLKRYSMIGDGLSHVGFGALALATALNLAPLQVSIPIVIIAAFFILKMSENSKINGDAAVALISTGSLAFGVMVISLSTGINTDVCNYLFGTILGLSNSDVYLSIVLSIVVLITYALTYHKLFAITFDENFAQASGIKVSLYKMLLAILTALTVVLGMKTMGSLLISSLLIFPALSAMRLFSDFKSVSIAALIIAVICFISGMIVSYVYATPTGASISMANVIVFLIFSLIKYIKSN